MDKAKFDQQVAAIWSLYQATNTINSAGIGVRSTTEATQNVLRAKAAELGEALAASLAV